jgi:non-lysosomal glucosylceramidase
VRGAGADSGLPAGQVSRSRRRLAACAALAAVACGSARAAADSVVYSGDRLTGIDFPVGPTGNGGIQQLGDGTRNEDWIFNIESQLNSTWGRRQEMVPHSFFAVRAQQAGGSPVVRALQTVKEGPFAPMSSLTFQGEYPLARYDFADDALPVRVSESVDSPTVGGDLLGSSYPTAIYEFHLSNPGDSPVTVSLLATQQNAVGFDAQEQTGEIGGPNGRTNPGYGTNVNTITSDARGGHLDMTGCTGAAVAPVALRCNGSLYLSLLAPGAQGSASFPNEDALLEDFAADGAVTGPASAQGKLLDPTTPDWGETVDGALSATRTLAPGEQITIPVVFSWYIPTSNVREFGGEGVYYSNRWPNAAAIDRDVTSHLDELQSRTRAFHDALYDSNLPHYVLDRLTSQMATLHTPTVFWAQNGFLGGFEGYGCCTSMPTHVWHYAQLAQRLWPEIDDRWESQWLDHELPGGLIPYRYIAPQFAMDGQNGVILGAYRYWTNTGDRAWLDRYWLKIAQAMEYVIANYDPDGDGMLSGEQRTTLDTTSSGTNSWLGTMYLAALHASQKMAAVEGDTVEADRFGQIYETGRANQEKALWNGAWYVEKPDATRVPIPQQNPASVATTDTAIATITSGNGVMSDMLLGQWWSTQLGLGDIYDPAHMTTALRTLYDDNFRSDFASYDTHGGRVFVQPQDSGMVMMTWPKNDRPSDASMYSDEVWSGQEYAAAATMIQRGLVDAGLRMVKAVADRYDGRLRTHMALQNCGAGDGGGDPFGDDECGKWYARAMSVWSVLLALQGFSYDAPQQTIGFAPRWQPDDHRSFFSAGDAWGTFAQRRDDAGGQTDDLILRSGSLTLRKVTLAASGVSGVRAELDGTEIPATLDGTTVVLASPVTVGAGHTLHIELLP